MLVWAGGELLFFTEADMGLVLGFVLQLYSQGCPPQSTSEEAGNAQGGEGMPWVLNCV